MNISLNGYGTGYVTLEAPKASPKAFSPRFPQTIPPLPPGTAKPSSARCCRSGTAWPSASSRAYAP